MSQPELPLFPPVAVPPREPVIPRASSGFFIARTYTEEEREAARLRWRAKFPELPKTKKQ